MKIAEALCERARDLIASRLGLDFPASRRADLERALHRAVRVRSTTPEQFLEWLAALPHDSVDLAQLAALFTVGETYFFRDRACFEALEREFLPTLIAARRAQGTRRLRLWSAGCASGEEPYSLAILLDRLLPDRSDWAVTVLATDISTDALEMAQRGVYRRWSLRELPPDILGQYFHREANGEFTLAPQIRRMVSFAVLNLVGESYPAMLTNTVAMDLIVCRNVLMYFTPEAQRATLARLQQALVPGGRLLVAPVEAPVELMHQLEPVSFLHAVCFRNLEERGGVDCRLETAGMTTGPAVLSPSCPQSFSGHPGDGAGVDSCLEMAATTKDRAPAPAPVAPPHPPADDLLHHAEALADQGRVDEARTLCERRLAQEPLDAHAYFLLGTICQEQGDLTNAVTALQRSIYLAPESAVAHYVLGGLLQRQQKRPQARRSFEAVVQLLNTASSDDPVAGADGLTAGHLVELARTQALATRSTARVKSTSAGRRGVRAS